MKKMLFALLTVVTILSMLVACGPAPTAEKVVETVVVTKEVPVEVTKEVVKEVVVTPTPAPETGPRTLTFFTTEADPSQLEILATIIDEYHEAHPDVFIDVVTGTPATRGARITTLLAAGADAGIFEIEAAFTRQWAEAGYLLSLDDIFEGIGGVDEYVPGSYFELEDTIYALPYATSVYGLWYRKDLFEEAGIEPPTNYEELLAAAEALTDPAKGIYGIALPGSTNASANYFAIFLWQNCQDFFTPQGEIIFDQPGVLEAVEKWAALAKYAPPGFENWSFGDLITAFLTGQAAMTVYAGRLGIRMVDQAPQLEDLAGITRLPWCYKDGCPYVTYGSWSRIAIAANTQYPETAKDFLKFLLTGDRLARYDATVIGHMVPPTKEVAKLLESWDSDYARKHSDWLAFFNEDAAFTAHPANNMGPIEGCNFVKKDYGPPWAGPVFSKGGIVDVMFQEIYVGGKDPEVAWKEAVEKIKQAREEWLAAHPDWEPPTY